MKWLFGIAVGSLATAIVGVRIVEYFLGGVVGAAAGAAKAAVFSSVWAAVTSSAGMRAWGQRVRQARLAVAKVRRHIDRRVDRM